MTNNSKFLKEDIPYEKMEKLGLSRRDVLRLPRDVLEPLMSGRATPLIMTRYHADNGKTIEMPMKLQLVRDGKDGVSLMTYQVRRELEPGHLRLNDHELQRLKNGEAVQKEVQENGQRLQKFVQLDPETRSLMLRSKSSVMIAEGLREVEKVKDIELGANQKQAVIEGKPVELAVGDQKVTVGVDLREPQGFRVVNGDMNEWERQMKIRYDLEHEGFMGYVMTDQNRWEYRKVAERLSDKEELEITLRKEEKRSPGLRL